MRMRIATGTKTMTRTGAPNLTVMMLMTLILTGTILGDSGVVMSGTLPHNQFFTPGETMPVAEFVALPTGSVYQICHTDTPLDGIVFHVPPGTVPFPANIQIALNTGILRMPDIPEHQFPVLQISFEKNIRLARPVRVSVPLPWGTDPSAGAVTAFSVNEDGSLSLVMSSPAGEVSGTNHEKGLRFSLYTFHPGLFTWIMKPHL